MSFQIESSVQSNYSFLQISVNPFDGNNRDNPKPGKSNVYICALNTINTVLGGGILTLPYTMLQCGVIFGTTAFIISLLMGIICIKLLLELKEITGHSCYASIAYECMGRKGLIVINILIAILCLGVPLMFIVVFADAATPLVEDLLFENYSRTREIVVVCNAIILLWFCFNKEVHNLRIASYTSIICVGLFFYVIVHILIYHWEELDNKIFDHIDNRKDGYTLTIPNIILAFGFHPCFFPLYNSLKPELKNSKSGMKFTSMAFVFTFVVYISICCFSLIIFGDSLKSDILKNISESDYEYRRFILFVYLIISLMHMPMVFFSGKEAFLNLCIELKYGKISQYCEKVKSDSALKTALTTMEYKSKSFVKEMDNLEYYILTSVVYITTFSIAFIVTDLGQIVAFLGTSTCFVLCFPIPAIFYLLLTKPPTSPRHAPSQTSCNKSLFLKYTSWAILAVSTLFMADLAYEVVQILR
ncbi:unnamed protein product [Moneuplotes crassus]|uniref:Amino acid transporter transmembrane domain-containing protein n=1 Tax=Euplotes crassus TaxID=5936 RepID=A0AAD1UE71_EUPCR|nr:unnamed protein product [Moneuplotes crassus]